MAVLDAVSLPPVCLDPVSCYLFSCLPVSLNNWAVYRSVSLSPVVPLSICFLHVFICFLHVLHRFYIGVDRFVWVLYRFYICFYMRLIGLYMFFYRFYIGFIYVFICFLIGVCLDPVSCSLCPCLPVSPFPCLPVSCSPVSPSPLSPRFPVSPFPVCLSLCQQKKTLNAFKWLSILIIPEEQFSIPETGGQYAEKYVLDKSMKKN